MIDDHAGAVNYDLLTRTGYTLDDVGGRLSWSALSSFIRNLGTDSALARELGKATGWETTLQTNVILADLYDLLYAIHRDICALGGVKTREMKYPRPGVEDKTVRKFGKGALPVQDLHNWIKERQGHD